MSNLVEQLALIVGDKAVLSGEMLKERATSYWDSASTQAQVLVKPWLLFTSDAADEPPCVDLGCPRTI